MKGQRNKKQTINKAGIDSGLSGAIAGLCGDKVVFLKDLPTAIVPWKKPWTTKKRGILTYQRMIDSLTLRDILLSNIPLDVRINIEIVHSRDTDGKKGLFTFGGVFYTIVNTCLLAGYDVNMIKPARWKQKIDGINKGKDYPRRLAIKEYPHLFELLKYSSKHQDRGDAIYIAKF